MVAPRYIARTAMRSGRGKLLGGELSRINSSRIETGRLGRKSETQPSSFNAMKELNQAPTMSERNRLQKPEKLQGREGDRLGISGLPKSAYFDAIRAHFTEAKERNPAAREADTHSISSYGSEADANSIHHNDISDNRSIHQNSDIPANQNEEARERNNPTANAYAEQLEKNKKDKPKNLTKEQDNSEDKDGENKKDKPKKLQQKQTREQVEENDRKLKKFF